MIRADGCTATARSRIHDGVCAAGKYWPAPPYQFTRILVVSLCLGLSGAGCTCSLEVEWDQEHVTARQTHCLGLTGGEGRVSAPRRHVPRASKLHAGISSALQCTC